MLHVLLDVGICIRVGRAVDSLCHPALLPFIDCIFSTPSTQAKNKYSTFRRRLTHCIFVNPLKVAPSGFKLSTGWGTYCVQKISPSCGSALLFVGSLQQIYGTTHLVHEVVYVLCPPRMLYVEL